MKESVVNLVEQWEKYAYKLANRYHRLHMWLDNEDLAQEALIGIMEAAVKFDSGRGVKFSTFAYRYVLGRLADHASLQARKWPVSRAHSEMKDDVAWVDVGSIRPNGNKSHPFSVCLHFQMLARLEFEQLSDSLTARQRDVLILRLAYDMSAEEAGKYLGISHQAVASVLKTALRDVKRRSRVKYRVAK